MLSDDLGRMRAALRTLYRTMPDHVADPIVHACEMAVLEAKAAGYARCTADVVAKVRQHANKFHPATEVGQMYRIVALGIERGEHEGAAQEREEQR